MSGITWKPYHGHWDAFVDGEHEYSLVRHLGKPGYLMMPMRKAYAIKTATSLTAAMNEVGHILQQNLGRIEALRRKAAA